MIASRSKIRLHIISYRPFGQATGMDTGAGGTVANQYDLSGHLQVANPGTLMERTYGYDANGNLETVTVPNIPWYQRSYTYDALNRLTQAVGPYGTIDYTYDNVGNRQTKSVSGVTDTYAYLPGTNKIDNITGADPAVSFSYDANGNITGMDNGTNMRSFVYNQNNRLLRVEENSVVLGEYTYNGLGQRVIKTAGGLTTLFHYDFNGNIIAESDQSGNFTREYLYRGNSRIAMVDVATGERFDFGNDRLGTPQIVTDSGLTVVWEAIYKPFGEADVNPNSSVVNNFRFPGQYYGQETGLHYNYHRYYDPRTGRYLTPDPIGQIGGINLYPYVANNPVNFIDPSGLFIPPPVVGGIVGGIIGGTTAFLGEQNVLLEIGKGAITGAAATYGVLPAALTAFIADLLNQKISCSPINIDSSLRSAAFAAVGTGLGNLFNWAAGGGPLAKAIFVGMGANLGIWLEAPISWRE